MKFQSKVLGALIERQRFEHKRLTRKALASMLGFKDLGKGVWKIEQIERGKIEEPLVSRICEILEISEFDRKRCQKEERDKMLAYRKTLPPFKPHISMRLGSCSGKIFAFPGHITDTGDMISYTIGMARSTKRTLRLWLDYDLSYVVEPDGKYMIDRKYYGGRP